MSLQSGIQIRTFDPFAELDSDVLNRNSSILVPGGRAVITGMECSITNTNVITVSKGVAVKERVIIEYVNSVDLTVDVSLDTYLYVVLTYNFQKVCPPPEALIRVISPSSYDSSSDMILNVIRVDGGQIVSVLNADPLDPSHVREDVTLIDEKIADHNVDPNAHLDIRAAIGGGAGTSTEIILTAGETLSEGDPIAIINSEAVKATNDDTQGLSLLNVIGIALGNANSGDNVSVQISGIAELMSWSFLNSSSAVVYLGDGLVTDTLPITGAVVLVGYKAGNNSLFVLPRVLYLRA